jgi:uncharacterized membrane protein
MTLTPTVPSRTVPALARRQSIDVLRGLVMVIMALDHVRDFFHAGAQHFSPEDLTQTTAVLFFTRWITHFCAPVFVFLAGTGAYLSAGAASAPQTALPGKPRRGAWLILVEMAFCHPRRVARACRYACSGDLGGLLMIALSVLIACRGASYSKFPASANRAAQRLESIHPAV